MLGLDANVYRNWSTSASTRNRRRESDDGDHGAKRGYAIGEGEQEGGVRCVAVELGRELPK